MIFHCNHRKPSSSSPLMNLVESMRVRKEIARGNLRKIEKNIFLETRRNIECSTRFFFAFHKLWVSKIASLISFSMSSILRKFFLNSMKLSTFSLTMEKKINRMTIKFHYAEFNLPNCIAVIYYTIVT